MAPGDFGLRHSRWRTWLRIHTPNVLYYRLGLAVPKALNCGNHEWHNAGNGIDACYHCRVERPRPPPLKLTDYPPVRVRGQQAPFGALDEPAASLSCRASASMPMPNLK
jgi:hypothetical protein